MKMRIWLNTVTALAVLAGCADRHRIERVVEAQQTLSPAASAYIAVPENGRYGSKAYDSSGRMASSIIAAAFMRRLVRVEQAARTENYDEALAAARKNGATYLVVPDILHWEDRATEWSGKPDRAEVRIKVIDTASERLLASGLISGRSGLATLGGDHPQDLLPQPTEEYVRSLF